MLASATFQIISAVVAVLGFLFGIVRWRDATRARDETRELQKREQANKVHAWAEKRTGDERLVVVENASDAPVHDVKAWLVRPGTALPAGGVPDKKPTTQRTHLLANSSLEYPFGRRGRLRRSGRRSS